MLNLKNILKYLAISLISILIGLLLITTLYYYDILGSSFVNYLRLFMILFILFITSYKLGKKTEKNGYLEGGKFGLLNILVFFGISLLFFREDFKLRLIIYYIILLFTTILGSMIGINKTKKS